MVSGKFLYQCTGCGKEYSNAETMYLCPDCSKLNTAKFPPRGVLKILYDYPGIRKGRSGFHDLKNRNFLDLLPVENCDSLPKLRVGKTPLYTVDKLNGYDLPFYLHLKDDSQNPTFSFKDRASALVSAYAKERNYPTIVAASTGNAGSSLAGICASQGQTAVVLLPETAPVAKLTQIMMYGAKIVPVKGTYDEAFDLSMEATRLFGWYNRNTAFNPLTIEGKKTVSFELFADLDFNVPDRIFVPVGDGVILSGVYKGFEELLLLGLTDKMPVIVAVQSEGSDNLVRNIPAGDFTIIQSHTIADSISVDIPRNFFMARQFILQYHGETVTVSDDEILEASAVLSRNTGIFAEPAAATAFAGMLAYRRNEKIAAKSDNVVLLTGSGLKDLNAVSRMLKIPASIYPSANELKKLFP
jgi:threonine synthase